VLDGNCPRMIIPATNIKELNANGDNIRSEYSNEISVLEKLQQKKGMKMPTA
jgi:antitoxin component of MazEF toxin-antitoxin module